MNQSKPSHAETHEHTHIHARTHPRARTHTCKCSVAVCAERWYTAPRQNWHADTIPLASKWQKAKHALILVDDFILQFFVKLLKDKTQFQVADALNEHFAQQRPFSTGVKGSNLLDQILVTSLRYSPDEGYVCDHHSRLATLLYSRIALYK